MSLEALTIISVISTLSALLVFLLFYSRAGLWKTKFRWVGLLLLGSVSFDGLNHILFSLKINPNYSVNSWIVFEFLMCSLLYFSFFKKKGIRSVILVITSILTVFGFYNFFFLEGPTTLNSYTRSLVCVVMVCYSVYFFFQLLKDLPTSKLTKFPMFWVNTGMLLFFSGTFMLSISIRYLVDTLSSNLIFFWAFLLGLNFLRNILFGIGSWCRVKTPSSI